MLRQTASIPTGNRGVRTDLAARLARGRGPPTPTTTPTPTPTTTTSVENDMRINAYCFAGWSAMPRISKVGEGGKGLRNLLRKYDDALWRSNESSSAYEAIVDAVPHRKGSRYYFKQALKICDDRDARRQIRALINMV